MRQFRILKDQINGVYYVQEKWFKFLWVYLMIYHAKSSYIREFETVEDAKIYIENILQIVARKNRKPEVVCYVPDPYVGG